MIFLPYCKSLWNESWHCQPKQNDKYHNVVPVNKVKLWNLQQHVLCCRLAIKETNFVINFNSSVIAIFYSRRRHCKYDWLELVWVWLAADRSFFRIVTLHAFIDRQTDRRTAFSSLDGVCIPCNAVKKAKIHWGRQLHLYGDTPTLNVQKRNYGMTSLVADVIIRSIFYRNLLRGFRAVRGLKWWSSIDFDSRPYNRSALPCCLW